MQSNMSKNVIFRDFSLNFLPNPITGDVSIVTNEQAVIQSIKNIILTDLYEKPFKNQYGGNVKSLLFENSSFILQKELSDRIEVAIQNYEKRIQLLDVVVRDDSDNNRYFVDITFTIILSSDPVTVSFFIERVL